MMDKQTELMLLKHYRQMETLLEDAKKRERFARCFEIESYLSGFSQAVLFVGSAVIQDYVLSKPDADEGE